MTPEKREQLTAHLAQHGLSVLMTKDLDGILLQLAKLAQFNRLMLTAAAGNPVVEFAVDHVQREQACVDASDWDFAIPMETANIPWLLQAVNVELQQLLDKRASIQPDRLPAAVAAFSAIISRR